MRLSNFSRGRGLLLSLSIWLASGSAWALTSYAVDAVDVSGSTGAASVALGVPDYAFVNDAGLPFGGTSTDVFDVGESTTLAFPARLRNVAGQHDLIVLAFVGGLGQTDNATVQVEVSSDGVAFATVATFDTEEARDRSQDRFENDFDGVKQFWVEFGSASDVTHVRLTNLGGTAEGLRLDAVEGLHPDVASTHAFEMRFARYREDSIQQFKVRVKTLSDVGGVPVREVRIDRPMAFASALEATDHPIVGLAGRFICVENCIPNNGPLIPFSRHAWSTDGVTEAAPGEGLDPGREAAHERFRSIDLETIESTYLAGYEFTVTFADGFVHRFTYDDDVLIGIGRLYQKYLYFESNPVESGPRQADYYEFRRSAATGVPLFPYLP